MGKSTYPIVAKEGWPFLGLSLLISLVLTFTHNPLSWPTWIITLFILQFFRDPARSKPSGKDLVLSAADGKVIVIEKAIDPYRNKEAIKVSVFMNVFNVHSNKSPVDGKILEKFYYPGKFLNASLSKASLENERCAITIETKSGKVVTCVQIAGLIARRILCYKEKGQSIMSGERYGFIRFGSRVDLYLPLTASIKVSLGQTVKNTETVIAKI
ncbi:MAG: phosphatidylserine decarboxylase [Methylophilales bacterium BACL14 MAG-120910-bin43]|nr:MAG: phosphatidylserine decarboxylase [Methylophilales bacterium BACL14 MAG-120910-bin43]